jgi:hypothetical protein
MSQAVSTSGNTQHMVKYIDPTSSNDQLYLLLLASPFLFYTVLWFIPSLWVSMIGSAQPSDTMAQVAHVLKLVQGYVLYSLCKDHYLMPGQWIEELGQTTVICSVFLMVLGQYLNVSVYNALGTNGVYYGVRFGIDVPWCHDFPYNVSWLKHPQYVGSIMSIIAAIPLIQLPLTWSFYIVAWYLYMCVIESYEITPAATFRSNKSKNTKKKSKNTKNKSKNTKKKTLDRNVTLVENPEEDSADDSSDDDDEYNRRLLEERIEQRHSPVKKTSRASRSSRSTSKPRSPVKKAVKKKQKHQRQSSQTYPRCRRQ